MPNNDVLRLWEAMEPMAKSAVERQTRDSLRVKQMVVSTAYSDATGTVGVREPFGDEIQLPVYGGVDTASLTIGTAVWVFMPFSSMSNACVFCLGDMHGIQGETGSALETRIASLESSVGDMWKTIYPVGSLYISVSATSPQTLFGGTWERIQDTFLLAAGSTYSAGDTGGEATHTLLESELPNITGTIVAGDGSTGSSAGGYGAFRSATGAFSVANIRQYARPASANAVTWPSGDTHERVNMSFGGDGNGATVAHNNMPPYLAVYVWKRTA